MANFAGNRFAVSYEDDKTIIFGRVTFGTSGAPTLDAINSKGVASISRTSAGLFVITLKQSFWRYYCFEPTFLVASGFPAAPLVAVVSQAVKNTTPTITVQCSNTSGTATDPASGEEMDFVLFVKNTSVP